MLKSGKMMENDEYLDVILRLYADSRSILLERYLRSENHKFLDKAMELQGLIDQMLGVRNSLLRSSVVLLRGQQTALCSL
jgi:hypothetical protein